MVPTTGPMTRRPLVEEIDAPSALEAFSLIRGRPHSFFLDSGMGRERLGRYSFIGSDPFLVLKSYGRDVCLVEGCNETRVSADPFDVLREVLSRHALDPGPAPIPFTGGAVGYLGYDLCHFVERLPQTAADDLGLPELYLAFYDGVIGFDHLEGRCYVAASGLPCEEEERRLRRARERLDELKDIVERAPRQGEERPMEHGQPAATPVSSVVPQSNFTHEGYVRAVAAAREYICAGDIFQVNLSQRFQAPLDVAPFELYRRLRAINPAPFASYLNLDGVTIVSASPERFLRTSGDLVETRPIKGTRPRGRTPAQDQALAWELAHSVKDRAENVMIVDLERNDLGRVCRYGTVRVSELCALERYATVFHLTSTVEGRLRHDRDRVDLLKATFPGGSITGAPKVRAMEIIDELEPTRRGVYTGSIGYAGFDGEMDLNIVIRTFVVAGGKAYFQVGGGIVYDSDPEAEYVETLDKARALVESLGPQPLPAPEER